MLKQNHKGKTACCTHWFNVVDHSTTVAELLHAFGSPKSRTTSFVEPAGVQAENAQGSVRHAAGLLTPDKGHSNLGVKKAM